MPQASPLSRNGVRDSVSEGVESLALAFLFLPENPII